MTIAVLRKGELMSDLISRQMAIDTEGLYEEIRCEICRNPMHTNRGCDGNCKYDEKLYERIMQILDRRIKHVPSVQQEIIRCKDCKHKGTRNCVANTWAAIFGFGVKDDFYCGLAERAERRTDGSD